MVGLFCDMTKAPVENSISANNLSLFGLMAFGRFIHGIAIVRDSTVGYSHFFTWPSMDHRWPSMEMENSKTIQTPKNACSLKYMHPWTTGGNWKHLQGLRENVFLPKTYVIGIFITNANECTKQLFLHPLKSTQAIIRKYCRAEIMFKSLPGI